MRRSHRDRVGLQILLLLIGITWVLLVSAAFTSEERSDPAGARKTSGAREPGSTPEQDRLLSDSGGYAEAPSDPYPLVVSPGMGRREARHFLSSLKLPANLEFAGQRVPLEQWHVRERIEYEFYQFLAAEGDSIIIAKRTGRCFPPVEKELARSGLPDDLKYMLLVESKCVASAYSRKHASGPWQFIRSTAKRFKLTSNKWRDERRNLERSTEAAIKYLQHLHDIFGDWFVALAAYNAGEFKIKTRLREQNIGDYWDLHYVRETMRYVPRVIAAKEIFSQPERYLGLGKADFYVPRETKTVTVRVKERKQHLATIAGQHGTYFLELKLLNPELRRSYLPRGTHTLKIPKRPCARPCGAENGSG